jgi:hypothetical protein
MYSTARYGKQVNAPCKSDHGSVPRVDRVNHPTYWLDIDAFGCRVGSSGAQAPGHLHKLRDGRGTVQFTVSQLAEHADAAAKREQQSRRKFVEAARTFAGE